MGTGPTAERSGFPSLSGSPGAAGISDSLTEVDMAFVTKMKLDRIKVDFKYDDEDGTIVEHKLKLLLDDAPGSSLQSIIDTVKEGDDVLQVAIGDTEFFGFVDSSKVKFNYDVDGMSTESPLEVKVSTQDLDGEQIGAIQDQAADQGSLLEIVLRDPQQGLFDDDEVQDEVEEKAEEAASDSPEQDDLRVEAKTG